MAASTIQNPALLEELHELFRTAKIPTSPAVATRILELINDPNSSARQFANAIETDPALAARLLRLANSARYAQRSTVTTIQRAVTVVGLRQLRVIALGFELVNHLDQVGNTSFDLPSFWQRSVIRACLAREVALRTVSVLAQEAFLVGLLQDCGIPLLAQLLGGEYADTYSELKGSPVSFLFGERKRFRYDHVQAITALASMWGLPEVIATPLARHHERPDHGPNASDETRLWAVSYFVGALGFDDVSVDAAQPPLQSWIRGTLGLTESDLESCLEETKRSFDEMAELFDASVLKKQNVAGLIQMANRRLLEQAEETEGRLMDIEEERDQMLDQQETLRNALGQYREQAARDPLTGLLNRRALLDATVECVGLRGGSPRTVTVLFLDLDDFKGINDRFGHLVGDEVLQGLAEVIRAVLGEGAFAGRYGGEEFVVVLPGLGEDQARDRAQQLLESVREITVESVSLDRPITCSIGAVWCHLSRAMTAESLFGASDELMYIAKKGGKDRVSFRALKAAPGCADEDAAAGDNAAPEAGDGGPIHVIGPDQVDAFRTVAERLDGEHPPGPEGNRKQPRPSIFTPCILGCFNTRTLRMSCEEAYIRNVSVGGIGVLLGRPLVRGDVVEVTLTLDDKTMHLAGLVSFCRLIDGSIHEIGVQVVQSGHQPIITGNQTDALQDLGWVADALHRRRAGEDGDRLSA